MYGTSIFMKIYATLFIALFTFISPEMIIGLGTVNNEKKGQ